jgi:hypothetical protein
MRLGDMEHSKTAAVSAAAVPMLLVARIPQQQCAVVVSNRGKGGGEAGRTKEYLSLVDAVEWSLQQPQGELETAAPPQQQQTGHTLLMQRSSTWQCRQGAAACIGPGAQVNSSSSSNRAGCGCSSLSGSDCRPTQ